MTRAQEAEENYLVKRELATVKQQSEEASAQLEQAHNTIRLLQQQHHGVSTTAVSQRPPRGLEESQRAHLETTVLYESSAKWVSLVKVFCCVFAVVLPPCSSCHFLRVVVCGLLPLLLFLQSSVINV